MKPPETFTTNRLILRRPQLADAPTIYNSYARDQDVTRYLAWKCHSSIGDTIGFLNISERDWNNSKTFPYAICLNGSDELIGMIVMSLKDFKAIYGYVLAKKFWGNGYVTEALKTLMDWCLSQPSILRAWAFCDVENLASARVMEKAGMKMEGVMKRWHVFPNISDEPRDCFVYAKTK
jgi:[ribosomal protein S5]-alanine N-acetyltransferase